MSDTESTDDENEAGNVLTVRPRSRWKKRILIGGVAVILVVSGMFIGGGAVIMRMRRAYFASAVLPQHVGRQMYEDVRKRAKLDAAQTERVKSVIDSRFQAMEGIRERSSSEMRNEFEGMRDDVAKILRPEDAAQWNKRMNQYLDRFSSERRKP